MGNWHKVSIIKMKVAATICSVFQSRHDLLKDELKDEFIPKMCFHNYLFMSSYQIKQFPIMFFYAHFRIFHPAVFLRYPNIHKKNWWIKHS